MIVSVGLQIALFMNFDAYAYLNALRSRFRKTTILVTTSTIMSEEGCC